MAEIRIGTSGWNYRAWRGSFFPETLPAKEWLTFYASQFNSVEVNYSFYRLPSEDVCNAWYRQTPDDFIFAMKASRYLTHIKRLIDVGDAWKAFVARVSVLKHKLGPILLQFPSTFAATGDNQRHLNDFLQYATKRADYPRLALEFRNKSCFDEQTIALLRKYGVALVISHSNRYPAPAPLATADFAYFRFHGPREMFASSYTDFELDQWADRAAALSRENRLVYAYFNNDSGGHAPRNARDLRHKIELRQSEQFPDKREDCPDSH
jgi:uncharacterized protein YecE (DUF72 family)